MTDSNTSINNVVGSLQQQTNNNIIIRNKKTSVNYFNQQYQERLPSISEWFAQPSAMRQDDIHTKSQQQETREEAPFGGSINYQQHTQIAANTMIVRNRSISNGTTIGSEPFSTNYTANNNSVSHNNQQAMTQQNKLAHTNGRGKAPHSRVRSVPPVMMGNTSYLNTNHQIHSPNCNTEIITSLAKPNTTLHPTTISSTPHSNNVGYSLNSSSNSNSFSNTCSNNSIVPVFNQGSPFNNNTNVFQTVAINSHKTNTPSTPTMQPTSCNDSKNDFVLVIENEESIKQYSERASLHNPNPFNPLSRRISAKEVWNSIAAATQANKILTSNSPKITKSKKMSNSIGTPNRNRSFSPTSSSNTNLTQNSNQSSAPNLPLSSITIRSRKRSNSNPLVLPFDKLTLEDSPNNQKQNTENPDQLHLLGNEFVDFSNGEHESQRKNRGEKVFKFKMINF